MIDNHEGAVAGGQLPDDSDPIAQLLRLAGPREEVPPERAMRVKAVVRAQFHQQARARSRKLTIGWSIGALATAALVLIGLRLTIDDDNATLGSLPPMVARLEVLNGTVRPIPPSEGSDGGLVSFQVGDIIRAGSGVETTAGGQAALRLANGVSVRLDRGTRLQLVSQTALVLDEGAIYVDSGVGRLGSLEVRTKLGVARNIGTRFEVRLTGSALRVRVRDGLVRLTQGSRTHEARPGDEVTVDGKGGLVRRTVSVDGADWAWTVALAEPFELEGRSLRDFLRWICDESGWQLRFADAAVERKAATTILHGSIEGLTLDDALAAVLPTAGVEHQLENGVLLIRIPEASN